ncbi:hypothetical protein [Sphaerisporangium sp. NPDC051011]|uniref:hypothetical protein n=1 Tax=Sphaerisporangium sp. NPDC051011 TaxID=3155792 RepID=UPI0033FDB26E
MASLRPHLPVVLRVGTHEVEIGTVRVPFRVTPGEVSRLPGGNEARCTVQLDGAEFRRRMADLLLDAAIEIERASDGG